MDACLGRKEPSTLNDIQKGKLGIHRLATVPILQEGALALVLGVVDKKNPYVGGDLLRLQLITHILWRMRPERGSRSQKAESESLLRSLYSGMSDMVGLHDLVLDEAGQPVDYRILDCNPAFNQVIGSAQRFIPGVRATKYLSTEQPPHFEQFLDVVRTGQQKSFETYFAPLQRQFSITAIPTGSGKFATVTTDITERKRWEEALRDSEEKYRALVENSVEGVLVLQDGVLKFANTSAARMAECSLAEITGSSYADFMHPEDLPEAERRTRDRLKGKGPSTSFTYRVRTKKGNLIWIETNNALVQWEGRPATLIFMSDVSDRVTAMESLAKSEEKFSKAFHGSPMAILLTRIQDGKMLDFNDTVTTLTGYTREELQGLKSLDLGFWRAPQERQKIMDKIRSEGSLRDFEWEVKAKDGRIISLRCSAESIEVDGEACVLSTYMDVTQRKKDEKTIQELLERVERDNEELRRLDKLKNEFISIVAHDLRTPLTSINGYLRFLGDPRMGKLEPQQKEFVDLAYKNARRLANLVANFLDLSVMESGELRLNPRGINLNDVAEEAVRALENLANAKLIHLKTDLPDTAVVLMADPDKMEQVFINLLGNAGKFTPREGTITVGVRRGSKDGREGVLCWVKDTGPGIPVAEVEKVFEKFYQIEDSENKMKLGTGLGLTICRRIVEAHGGRIWVESVDGEGACFKCFLPER